MINSGKNGVYVDIHVQPKARRPGVRGVHGGRLKVAVAEPAEGGRANAAAVAAIADLLGVGRSSVSLASGKSSRRKRVLVTGMTERDAREIIEAAVGTSGSD